MVNAFPDGWAMSASAPSLRDLWPMTPADTRVAPWVKTFCAFKRGIRPAYAWEPVLFRSMANPPHMKHAPPEKGGKQTTPKDFHAGRITLQKGLTGAKPPDFCGWVLELLNVRDGDTVVDVFPGAGSMSALLRDRGLTDCLACRREKADGADRVGHTCGRDDRAGEVVRLRRVPA